MDDDVVDLCNENGVFAYKRDPDETERVLAAWLQCPFDHLYRDSDVEVMSDGHNSMTAYGYNDVSGEPDMGWARYTHTMRI